LLGKRGFVITNIGEKQSGMVKINGATWAARCVHGSVIHVGDEVEVVDVRGTHVIVKKI
jgi:membrane protein implicated in regulation of membrane protease activity